MELLSPCLLSVAPPRHSPIAFLPLVAYDWNFLSSSFARGLLRIHSPTCSIISWFKPSPLAILRNATRSHFVLSSVCDAGRNNLSDLAAITSISDIGRGPASAGPPSSRDIHESLDYRDFSPGVQPIRIQVDYPVLESEALFVRKAGDEITQQLYDFEDKGGRRVVLRPEPNYHEGQCWRYERMTKGMRREHYQWNMDIIGVSGVETGAELLSAIVMFFRKVGITPEDIGIRISNRKVLQSVLGQYSVPKDSFAAVCVVVDREDIEDELMKLGVSKNAVQGILGALSLQSLSEFEDLLGVENEAVKELNQLIALEKGYGYADWICFDAAVVRGPAYYTGIVFERFDKEGKLLAICGGGLYDHLLSTFGGPDIPACGFGFGDAVIVELLKEKGLLPNLQLHIDCIVFPLEEAPRPQSGLIANLLTART